MVVIPSINTNYQHIDGLKVKGYVAFFNFTIEVKVNRIFLQ